MKILIFITLLLIGQFAISQNDENINREGTSTILTSQKGERPFRGKINRRAAKLEESDLESAKRQTQTNTPRSESVYKETAGSKTNMKIARQNRSTEKNEITREVRQDKDSTFSENKNTGLKINSRRN